MTTKSGYQLLKDIQKNLLATAAWAKARGWLDTEAVYLWHAALLDAYITRGALPGEYEAD